MGAMNRLLLTTMPGLEAVAAAELMQEFGLHAVAAGPGVLESAATSGLPALVRDLNHRATCVDRVGILLDAGSVDSLESIGAMARELDVCAWLEPGARFAVRSTRVGAHGYRSPQIAAAVGAAVIAAVTARRGQRPTVDLDDPEVIFRADVRDGRLWLWLDTTGDVALHHRTWRRYTHMASMKPTVANLLLRLSGWCGEPLIDPFCGGATIPIEAASRAAGIAPGRFRAGGWAWQSLPALRDATQPAPSGDTAAARRRSAGSIAGIELFDRHLAGAIDNVGRAVVEGSVQLMSGRAEELGTLLPVGSTAGAFVVTNPPFGRRVSSAHKVATLYRDAAAAFARAGVRRVTTLAELRTPMREALLGAGFSRLQEQPATYGRTPVGVFVASRPGDDE